jgi:hypothetical protein
MRRVGNNLTELESNAGWNGTLLKELVTDPRWRQKSHWRPKELVRGLSTLLAERARAGTSAAAGDRATDRLHIHLRLGDAFAVTNLTAARVSAWCYDDGARPPWVRPPWDDGEGDLPPGRTTFDSCRNRAQRPPTSRQLDTCAAAVHDRSAAAETGRFLVRRGGYSPVASVEDVLLAVCALRDARTMRGRPWRGRRVLLVSGVHPLGKSYLNASCGFLRRLSDALRERLGVEVAVQSGTADGDLATLASAPWLLSGSGGYSRLAAGLVKLRGHVAVSTASMATAGRGARLRSCVGREELTQNSGTHPLKT